MFKKVRDIQCTHTHMYLLNCSFDICVFQVMMLIKHLGIFENILDKKGGFEDDPKNDVKVLLELYEASELRLEGEETLDGVREFTFHRLNELCSGRKSHQEREIMSSLAQPRHKTLRRLTSKRFISMIKTAGQEDKKWLQSLLRVAEIDSIMLEFLIQEEMSQIFK